jgi:chorismate lyase/3-hydroxybenzoate synthase
VGIAASLSRLWSGHSEISTRQFMSGARFTLDLRDSRQDAEGSGEILASIGYAALHHRDRDNPQRLAVGLPCLYPRDCVEIWRCGGGCRRGWDGAIGYAHDGDLLFAHLLVEEPAEADLTRLTLDAYRVLLAFIRSRGFPHLWRMWNFMEGIHRIEDGLERYQAFCVGRAQAFAQAGIPSERFPAATAIGAEAPGLLVYLLASSRAGVPIENPGQVSAYRYPSIYGPRPPGFARAMLVASPPRTRLLISGTASIIGHRSVHAGRLDAQLRQTLANLDNLVVAAAGDDRVASLRPRLLKVYLRHPGALDEVAPVLRAWCGPQTSIQYLRGDVCRRELLLEIEGVG